MLDFCAVAEFFEEQYDYTVPLKLPREPGKVKGNGGGTDETSVVREGTGDGDETNTKDAREIPAIRGQKEMKRWPTKPLRELMGIEKGKKAPESLAAPTRTSLRYLQIED